MADSSTSFEFVERMSGTLNRTTVALYNTASAFYDVKGASQAAFNTASVQVMTQEIYAYEHELRQTAVSLEKSNDKLNQMEEKTAKAAEQANILKKIYSAAAEAINKIDVQQILDTSDKLTKTTFQLDRMNEKFNKINDSACGTNELVQMVYDSAQNARGSFLGMAEVVTQFGNNAGNAFNNQQEMVNFANLIQKQMTIAGVSVADAENAMTNLSQAFNSGTVSGDELDSVFGQAPNIIRNIADYLEVPTDAIHKMALEGELTTDIVKNAVFTAADEINAQFEEMPITWTQIWQTMQDTALRRFQSVLQRINDIANDDGFRQFIDRMSIGIAMVANIVLRIFDMLGVVGSFVAENWSIIGPIIGAVTTLMLLYNGALLVNNVIQAISNGLKTIAAIRAVAHGTAEATEAAATTSLTAAQLAFNSALLACPLTWILVVIIALIAAIYGIVAAVNKATGSTYSATGIIAGAFSWLAASIVNTFVVPVQHRLAAFLNFLGNIFHDPIGAVKVLFLDLALSVIGYILSMASAIESVINKIPGVTVDITSGLDSFYDGLEQAQKAVKDETGWVEYVGKMDYVDAGTWADKGYAAGSGLEDNISSGLDELASDLDTSSFNLNGIDPAYTTTDSGSVADNLSNIANDTSNISDSVDISNENLKYLRDIAERDTINRFTTAEIKVDMQNYNTISNNMDLDGVVNTICEGINGASELGAEGVHE